MMKTSSRLTALALGASAVALAACGGGGGGSGGSAAGPNAPASGGGSSGGSPAPSAPTSYAVTNLVSDQAGVALTQDKNLIDAWGISFAPNAPVWVANNGTNTSTLYDGNGVTQSLVVTIPPGAATSNPTGGTANPTGVVSNSTSGFVISQGGASGPASFIFVGEEGTITGWNANVNATAAITAVDNSTAGAVYKGVGLFAPSSGPALLFAADFHNAKIAVFDSNFKPTTVANGFVDPTLPAGYAPFNVQVINNMVFVAYAEQNNSATPAGFNETDGAGLGFVDEFDTTGKFIMRFDAPGGNLNAPWGLAIAPANWGSLSGDLLVGNFGDGTISAYNPSTGAFVSKLVGANGSPVTLPGLWGISFGNGAANQPTTTLFFASGPSAESHGLYGRIDLPGAYTPPGSAAPAQPAQPTQPTQPSQPPGY